MDEFIEEGEDFEDIDSGGASKGSQAPAVDSMTLTVIVFTTVFLVIGIGLLFWELSNVYDIKGAPDKKDAKIFKQIKLSK